MSDDLTAVLRKLARALIEATPETWTDATLRLQARSDGLAHTIESEAHPSEPIIATDDVLAATRELQRLCEARMEPFVSLTFRVALEGDAWRFTADFMRPA